MFGPLQRRRFDAECCLDQLRCPRRPTSSTNLIAQKSGTLSEIGLAQQSTQALHDTSATGQTRIELQANACMHHPSGYAGLIEGNRQRQARHTRFQRVEYGVEPGMGDYGIGSRQHRTLGCEIGNPAGAGLE